MPEHLFAGLDGCKAGWVMVAWSGPDGSTPDATCVAHFSSALSSKAVVIGVDMPIGLPERSGRTCERMVRARIGQRQSSVFSVPSRTAVMERDYRTSCNTNLLHSDPPRKVSKQCFNLFPKIREIDAIMTPQLQDRVHEIHPEFAFWAMNTCEPLHLPKKIKSRVNPEGMALRRELLRQNGFPVDRLAHPPFPRSQVGEDDILDACACAWSAWRIANNEHVCVPQQAQLDARGLRMQISA